MRDYYEYQHVVGFEETDATGDVYYVNYLRWQGRCREMFLQECAPDVLADIRKDLKLFTLRVSCEFFAGVQAFDRLSVRMRLQELTQTQISFSFDYLRLADESLVARGRQRVACMRGPNRSTRPSAVPPSLLAALAQYATPAAVPAREPSRTPATEV